MNGKPLHPKLAYWQALTHLMIIVMEKSPSTIISNHYYKKIKLIVQKTDNGVLLQCTKEWLNDQEKLTITIANSQSSHAFPNDVQD